MNWHILIRNISNGFLIEHPFTKLLTSTQNNWKFSLLLLKTILEGWHLWWYKQKMVDLRTWRILYIKFCNRTDEAWKNNTGMKKTFPNILQFNNTNISSLKYWLLKSVDFGTSVQRYTYFRLEIFKSFLYLNDFSLFSFLFNSDITICGAQM